MTRLGVISDVHANLHALDAVLAALDAERVDAILCCGDLVGYGPYPNESVDRVTATASVCVAGNHDLIALGRLTTDRCVPLARDSLEWTADRLNSRTRARLAALPLRAFGPERILLAHGSIDDPQAYTVTAEDARRQLLRLHDGFGEARIVVLGHTHQPLAVGQRRGELLRGRTGTIELDPTERYLLNPGSVGQARDRRALARFLVLDSGARTARFHAIPYDVAACRATLVECGLPAGSCHQPPTLAQRARSLRRRARRWTASVRAG